MLCAVMRLRRRGYFAITLCSVQMMPSELSKLLQQNPVLMVLHHGLNPDGALLRSGLWSVMWEVGIYLYGQGQRVQILCRD